MDKVNKEIKKQQTIVKDANANKPLVELEKEMKQQITDASMYAKLYPEYQVLFGDLEKEIELQLKKIKSLANTSKKEYDTLFEELEKQLEKNNSIEYDVSDEKLKKLTKVAKSGTQEYKELFGNLEKEVAQQLKKINVFILKYQKI